MARLRRTGEQPNISRPTRMRTANKPCNATSPTVTEQTSQVESKTASNVQSAGNNRHQTAPMGNMNRKPFLPVKMDAKASVARIQRALRPLAHDNSLLRPATAIEPRRVIKASGTAAVLVGKENNDGEHAPRKARQHSAQLPQHFQEDESVIEEEVSVMEDEDEDWAALPDNVDIVGSEDEDEDDMPIKPSRTSRSPLKTGARRTRHIDLTETDSEDDTVHSKGQRRLSTSSAEDPSATLHFSPPLRSPAPTKPTSRPLTPPASPSKSKLVSPSKTVKHIPTLPGHRPSLDAFWSADEVNTWNDQYSPKKVLKSPRKNPLLLLNQPTLGPPPTLTFSDSEAEEEYIPLHKSKPITSPSKGSDKHASPAKSSAARETDAEAQARAATRALAASRKAFDAIKHSLATSFLAELDATISDGEIGRLTASTGGVAIVWSKKLTSTAGRAHWRREAVRTPAASAGSDPVVSHRHVASIEVATKVIDDAERLRNVLAHEYCHLANFMISRVTAEPHGASFKAWARKATTAFALVGVEVTTKHSYAISYKYAWVCVGRQGAAVDEGDGCGTTYQRHSKSIDVARQGCGKCKGRLAQVRPVPRSAPTMPSKADGFGDGAEQRRIPAAAAPKPKSGYQAFVSEQYKLVKAELGATSPMKEVMGEIGRRYRALKDDKSADTVKPEAEPRSRPQDNGERHDEGIDAVARRLVFLDLGN